MPCLSKKRQIAEIDAGVPCSPSPSRISAKVRSGASATSCSSQSRCRSSAVERREPDRLYFLVNNQEYLMFDDYGRRDGTLVLARNADAYSST